ncbi:histone-binding protein N1/N2-like [Antennarius striatus]|uniref:histone-binding protein N1/N2-like n=1 Tax=Antennarius striatus TaxID=241820 RepID=UPI0035B14A68
MEEANKLIGAGRKHLVMGRVVEAVSALQEACGLLAKKYGDTADECGEAFFWCGKALLDLSRMDNSVLGNALEGVPEEEEEEKLQVSNVESTENIDETARDELRHQVYDAMAEKKDEEKKPEGAAKVEVKKSEEEMKVGDAEKDGVGDDQQDAIKEEEKETSGKDGETGSEEKPENETAEEEEEEEEAEADPDNEEEEEEEEELEMEDEGGNIAEKDSDEEEEVGNLQLAWEMLEVAKVIYKRKETKEEQLMAAQAHLKLGEVSAESGNYTQALEDFQECLKLQLKHLEADSRLLAETHYQLGLTYSLDLQHRRAVDELRSSVSVIRSRLDKLRALLDGAEGPEALPEERKELEELEALLPEIQEKVEDASECLKTAAENKPDGGSAAEKSDSSSKVSGAGSTIGHASVSDISHLVRKKRKPEESPVKESPKKKVKQDAGQSNGVHTNGHAP